MIVLAANDRLEIEMNELKSQPSELARPSAAELRRLPVDERMAILRAQAAIAEELYRQDPELTSFEAFGEDDLYGDSSSAAER